MDSVDAILDNIAARLNEIVPADRDPKEPLSLDAITELSALQESLRYLMQDEPSIRERTAIVGLIRRINAVVRPPASDDKSDAPEAERVEQQNADPLTRVTTTQPYNAWAGLGSGGHL